VGAAEIPEVEPLDRAARRPQEADNENSESGIQNSQ
jgi:hypothetical protein